MGKDWPNKRVLVTGGAGVIGRTGGAMGRDSTVSILVPAASTPQVEAIHLVIEHLLMSLLKEALGGSLDER